MRPILPSQKCTLLGAALLFASVLGPQAASAATLDDFTVIVGGWQLERHCKHLDSDKRSTLGEIAAHAEIDMAGKYGAEKVGTVVNGAEEFGKEMGANCGDETMSAVDQSYGVAVEYATARTAEANRRAKRKQTKQRKTRKTKRKTREEKIETRATKPALARYGVQTEAYYLQYRCRHLNYSQAKAFWNLIKHQHYALIRLYGAGAVGRVSRRAKSSANASSVYCGAKTRRKVQAGLQAIRQDVVSN